jgi:hypothetical protein
MRGREGSRGVGADEEESALWDGVGRGALDRTVASSPAIAAREL